MPTPLATSSAWVEATLAKLSPDQKLAQLLHATLQPNGTAEAWAKGCNGLTPGGLFIFEGSGEQFRRVTTFVQDQADVPVVVSGDPLNCTGRALMDCIVWPELMGLVATGDPAITAAMAESSAYDARGSGVHWLFGPVVDLNLNPNNPITCNRSPGDDPVRAAPHIGSYIRALQSHGVAASPKHFPGDGLDDRDQHVCRTVNPLRIDEWFRLSGAAFQASIDAGAWSIMAGHISLPGWDPGEGRHENDFPPATLSKRLLDDLLRQRMGFDGLIISDAVAMSGVFSWGTREEVLPLMIMAGCDQLLFNEMGRDMDILRTAVQDGRLHPERIDQAVRKVLRFKEVIGLTTKDAAKPQPMDPAVVARHQAGAFRAAEKAVTVAWDRAGNLPMDLKGKKVLSVHVRGDPIYAASEVDRLLTEAGAIVVPTVQDEMTEGSVEAAMQQVDAVVVSFSFSPAWCTNRIRPSGRVVRPLAAVFKQKAKPVVAISFGSPYHGHDFPHMQTLINAYACDVHSQTAAVKALTGAITATGTSPVDLAGYGKVSGGWMGR